MRSLASEAVIVLRWEDYALESLQQTDYASLVLKATAMGVVTHSFPVNVSLWTRVKPCMLTWQHLQNTFENYWIWIEFVR